MNGTVEERNLQHSKDGDNFNKKNIRKAVITAAINIVYHTCNTKFFNLFLTATAMAHF